MRKALGLTAALCGFVGFGAQAQSLDTLQFAAQYQNGVSLTHDTVFAQRKKIAVPTAVNVLPSNVPYTATLRFIGENDTLVATYTSNGNSPLRTMNISADTVYASHIDFSLVADAPAEAKAVLVMQNILALSSCGNSNTSCNIICNEQFADRSVSIGCSTTIVGTTQLERAAFWTNTGLAHYFAEGCSQALSPSNNAYGIQIGVGTNDNRFAGFSAHHFSGEALGFLKQVRSSSLLSGYRYVWSFQVSLSSKSAYATNSIGMRLADAFGNDGETMTFSNITSTAWQKVSSMSSPIAANSNINTILIGDFGGTASFMNPEGSDYYNGAYYFVDDVRLSLVPHDLPNNLVMCANSIQIGEDDPNFNCLENGNSIVWEQFNGTTWESISGDLLHLTVSPTANTVYRRTVTIDDYPVVSVCTVTVALPPIVELRRPQRLVVCTGAPLNLAAVVQPTDGNYTYNWSILPWKDRQPFNPANPAYDAATLIPPIVQGGNSPTPTFTFINDGTNHVSTMITIELEVSNGNCTTRVQLRDTLDIINNCCVRAGTAAEDPAITDPSTLIVLGSPREGIIYNSLPEFIAPEMNTRYYVAGNIAFMSNITPPANSRFYVRGNTTRSNRYSPNDVVTAGPYIRVFNNAILRVQSSIFRAACDTMWGGIEMNDNSFYNSYHNNNIGHTVISRIEDSFDGLIINSQTRPTGYGNTRNMLVTHTRFQNNMNGIQFRQNILLSSILDNNNGVTGNGIARCVFTSVPQQMKFPFEFINNKDSYVSFAHVSNTTGVRVVCGTNSPEAFKKSVFANAVYGVRLLNHGGDQSLSFSCAYIRFDNCNIAGLWHTGGRFHYEGTDQRVLGATDLVGRAELGQPAYNAGSYISGITLPLTESQTDQVTWERERQNIPHIRKPDCFSERSGGNIETLTNSNCIESYAPTYGIYAANASDVLKNQHRFFGTGLFSNTFDHIGYFGLNSNLRVFATRPSNPIGTDTLNTFNSGNSALFENFRTAIMLTGNISTLDTLRGSRYLNNATAIRIHRTAPVNTSLNMACNDFMSLPSTGTTYPARTGIHITGVAGTTLNLAGNNSRLGGCESLGLSGRPVGSEVRNIINNKNETENNPPPALPANNVFNFRYINYQLGGNLQYYRYENENVSTVSNTNVQFRSCVGINDDFVLADQHTCFRTQVGVNYRKAAPVQQVSLLQNAPNPTRGITHISYTLPEEAVGKAQMVVYAPVSGKPMFSQTLQEVEGSIELNTKNWATGVYPYVLLIDGQVVQRNKLAVIK